MIGYGFFRFEARGVNFLKEVDYKMVLEVEIGSRYNAGHDSFLGN